MGAIPLIALIVFGWGLAEPVAEHLSPGFVRVNLQIDSKDEKSKAEPKQDDKAKQDESKEVPVGRKNWKSKTMGGQQFWTDVRHANGWRIQHNVATGHFRLIDPKNVRHAWGNHAHCRQEFAARVAAKKITPHSGKVVIVLHGLFRTHRSMQPMASFLNSKGYQTVLFQYASSREEVGAHAIALRKVIDSLGPDVTEINFVAHSLGNIVIRHYLGDTLNSKSGKQGDSRIGRIVMIGPPNQGSRMARLLKSSVLFTSLAGKSGAQLSKTWDRLEPKLAIPSCQFGIIAGGEEEKKWVRNFALKGPSDFTVSLKEAKLEGAHDLLVTPLFHSTMMRKPVTLESTLRFIEHGHFTTAEKRQPIPRSEKRK